MPRFLGGESHIEDFDADAMRQLWDVNVVSYFICAREAVRRMSRKRGGVVPTVPSMSADSGGIGPRAHYQRGQANVYFALAKQVGPLGIQ